MHRLCVTAANTAIAPCVQDSSISDARIVLDLLDAIKPGTINYDLVKDAASDEVNTHLTSVIMWYFALLCIQYMRYMYT